MPDLPVSGVRAVFTSRSVRVWKDMAYVFLGSPTLFAFDLKAEKWRRLSAVLPEGRWPYAGGSLDSFSMQIYDDKLYVFGGTNFHRSLGCNNFMVLDLLTLRWKYLGGSDRVEVTPKFPSLRQHAGSWVVEEQQKMCILFGGVNRTGAALGDSPHGGVADWMYEDLWSYSFVTQEWEQERMFGNIPCPRTEHSTTFSTQLGRGVVFGGYSPLSPLLGPLEDTKQIRFDFSYYADTFIWDPKTNNWSQVLTRSFPTYRQFQSVVF
jgi:N-acetylneuraminic acid mutarotase